MIASSTPLQLPRHTLFPKCLRNRRTGDPSYLRRVTGNSVQGLSSLTRGQPVVGHCGTCTGVGIHGPDCAFVESHFCLSVAQAHTPELPVFLVAAVDGFQN